MMMMTRAWGVFDDDSNPFRCYLYFGLFICFTIQMEYIKEKMKNRQNSPNMPSTKFM